MLLLLAWRDGQREKPRRKPGEGTVRRVVEAKRNRIVFRVRHGGRDYRSFSVRLDLPPAGRAAAEKAARAQAEACLADLRRRMAKGETPSASAERRTVRQATQELLDETRDTRGERHATYLTYRHWCRRILGAPIARMQLRDVRRADVAAWLGQLERQGVSAADRREAFARLLQVFRRELAADAELNNLRAVCDAARALRPHHEKAETRPFSEEEARLLLAAAARSPWVDDVPIGGVVGVCLFAKTRIGEACGLRWRDVDPFGETLTVAQQVTRQGGDIAPVKGKRAVMLPVDPSLVAALLEHRKREQERGRRCDPDDLVFVDRRKADGPVTYDRARGAFEKLTSRAGLGASGKTHRLRHASAMLSMAAGTPVGVLQRAMRHANLATTARYLHHDPTLAREDARAVGRRLRGE